MQNSEMMLKLKTAALKAREAEGGAEAQISESELVQQLEKELAIQRRLAEFNPDVVRFKMELDACKGRVHRSAGHPFLVVPSLEASLTGCLLVLQKV